MLRQMVWDFEFGLLNLFGICYLVLGIFKLVARRQFIGWEAQGLCSLFNDPQKECLVIIGRVISGKVPGHHRPGDLRQTARDHL